MVTQSELRERLREIGQEHEEIDRELNHYLDDMEYKPSYTLSRLLESIGTGRDNLFDPRSKEAKAIRRLAADIGIFRYVSEEELANTTVYGRDKKYAFKLDGEKYKFNKKTSEVVEG